MVDNEFDGFGKEVGPNYSFEGTYSRRRRVSGVLTWTEKQTRTLPLSSETVEKDATLTYTGNFDEDGNFTGKGILVSPIGKYEGEFYRGRKHGKGVFTFNN